MLKKIISSILIIIILTLWMPMQALLEVFSSYAENNTWNYAYTGDIQEFEAPYNGKYKIEVWGAQGGTSAVEGGLGGYSYVETILLKGEKLYIVCGGQGKNVGEGGYNGGGSSTQGGSGGGATHVSYTTGLLKDLSSQKDQLLVVAGGGGGSYHSALQDQETSVIIWINPPNEYETIYYKTDAFLKPGIGGGIEGTKPSVIQENEGCAVLQVSINAGTQKSGYQFGKGQDGNAGGGGGLYGGYAGNERYLSGAGGSGYLMETEFESSSDVGKNLGNGKASITYEGEVERTITIDTKECGSYEGKIGTIIKKTKVGENITLSDIVPKDGYQFLGYVDYEGNTINKTFTVGKENIKIKASFYAPLMIEKEKDGMQSIRVNIRQDDEFEKYYKVLQSKDGNTWYDAALSYGAKDGIPVKNKSYSPGSYTYVAPMTGEYKVRLYGAQGGSAHDAYNGLYAQGGKGAYTEGIITVQKGTIFYFFVGSNGTNGTWGDNCAIGLGGEATDIRVGDNTMTNRIMVAAGAGGGAIYQKKIMPGTNGGTLSSSGTGTVTLMDSRLDYANPPTGASQTNGGSYYWKGSGRISPWDGWNNNNTGKSSYAFNSGGGGYWQGNGVARYGCISGGTGGSSYISGYNGCTPYTGYLFKNTVMTAGVRSGSGYAYIDLLSDTNVYGNAMEDITFYDTAAPNKPSDAEVFQQDDNLTITWKNNGDNGNKYYHKVESYNKATNEKINTSNVLEDYLETGVVGWHYYMDENPTGTVTKGHEKTEDNAIEITKPDTKMYLHVAAVDGAGNLSDTYHYEIPTNVNYTVHYNGNGETNGTTEDSIHNYNESKDLTINRFEKKYTVTYNHNFVESTNINKEATYTFKNWNTKVDGTGTSYRNEEEVMNLTSKNGEIINLYAQWDADSITYVPERTGYKFIGWYQESTGTTRITGEDGSYTPTEDITLYAKWELITHDIEAEIIWNDEEDKYNSRPDEVEVTLNSDNDDIEREEGALQTPFTQTIEIPSDKTISNVPYRFENLQTKKTEDNTAYQYSVKQNKILGYETIIDSNRYTITNNLILPHYTSDITISPVDKEENERIKNEPVQIVGVITASETNRDKVGLYEEEVSLTIDEGIKIDKNSIDIKYIEKDGTTREITKYIIDGNTIKVTFESNKDSNITAGDSITIELQGKLQEVKEYTSTISYAGYLREYETGEKTNINLGTVTSATETMTVGKVSIAIEEINEENEITRGSHFEIRRKDTGEVVQSFITEGKEEAIRKLEPMVEYVVVETKPIEGYTTAEEVTFMLDEQGEIVIQNGAEKEENTIVIRDSKTRLQVEIRDELTKEYVTGPTWQIIRKTEQKGEQKEEIVAEWTSEGKEEQIEKLPIGEYTLREIAIGKDTGYVTVEEVKFKIEDTKEIQLLEVEQKISKVRIHLRDIEKEDYVEGAALQIIQRNEENGKVEEKVIREWITGQEGKLEQKLPVGQYIIREVKLPENSGYVSIEERKIKVEDTLEEQQVELKQDITKIKIEIIDEETKEKIDKVEVEIIEKETGKVIKLEETEEGYVAKRIPIGDYIIREKTPDGYKEIKDIDMEVKDTAEVQTTRTENKRLIYDMQVEKELTSITIDGEKKLVAKGDMQKIEIQSSKINSADIRLEYVIRVNNVGETKATIGKIIDNIPEGFNLVSTNWTQEGSKAIYNAEKEELQPNESKEVRIVLRWENKESNFGEKKNIAELKGSTNPYGYEDKNTDNNIGEEITIFSIKTGPEEMTEIIQMIITTLLASITVCFMVGSEIRILKRKS